MTADFIFAVVFDPQVVELHSGGQGTQVTMFAEWSDVLCGVHPPVHQRGNSSLPVSVTANVA